MINIGDRVRMLHAKEEGIVTRLLSDNMVEVEIEDGFRIPVLHRELTVIASEEAVQFKKSVPAPTNPVATGKTPVLATSGLYLAFVSVNDTLLALYLLNNTDLDVPYTVGEMHQPQYKGLQAGLLKARTSVKLDEVSTKEFDKWPVYVLQFLFFSRGFSPEREPLTKKIRFRANTFFKSKQSAPLLNKDAYLFQLDQEPVNVQPGQLLEKMLSPKEASTGAVLQPPAKEIDLHIERLTKNHQSLSNADMLQLQLRTFEQTLDQAIATGMPEITFIHGVGNGVLRTEIHRRLGKHANVAYFQDARKEKFGYGATLVKLK